MGRPRQVEIQVGEVVRDLWRVRGEAPSVRAVRYIEVECVACGFTKKTQLGALRWHPSGCAACGRRISTARSRRGDSRIGAVAGGFGAVPALAQVPYSDHGRRVDAAIAELERRAARAIDLTAGAAPSASEGSP